MTRNTGPCGKPDYLKFTGAPRGITGKTDSADDGQESGIGVKT